jgi:hypothetical protein
MAYEEAKDLMAEVLQRNRMVELHETDHSREALEKQYGKVYTLEELRVEFEITGFAAPYVVVRRRSDNQVGTLEFVHMPRLYFNFEADKGA